MSLYLTEVNCHPCHGLFNAAVPATPATPEGACSPPPPPLSPLFCVAKREKGDKSKKERVSKQKLLKGCHQGQNITILAILECLEFENLSCRSTMVASITFQCSMAPPTLKSISPALTSLLLLLIVSFVGYFA